MLIQGIVIRYFKFYTLGVKPLMAVSKDQLLDLFEIRMQDAVSDGSTADIESRLICIVSVELAFIFHLVSILNAYSKFFIGAMTWIVYVRSHSGSRFCLTVFTCKPISLALMIGSFVTPNGSLTAPVKA